MDAEVDATNEAEQTKNNKLHYHGESSGITYEVSVMEMEERPRVIMKLLL